MSLRQESFPQYGEVWLTELDPAIGSEIGKRRPAVIVSNNLSNRYSAIVTVLPITSAPARRDYRDEVVVPEGIAGLPRRSRIKANMIRTIDKSRLIRFIGVLPQRYYSNVNQAIQIHLNMP